MRHHANEGKHKMAGYNGPRGKAGKGKRAAIKRDWLASIAERRWADDWAALAARHRSKEGSARSMIGDLQATMRQCPLRSHFAEAAGNGKPHPKLEMINCVLLSDPDITTDDLTARLHENGILARRPYVLS